jgi:ubiquinone biosynthesis protein
VLGTLGHGFRLCRAGFVLAREGAFSQINPQLLGPGARLPLAMAKLIARRDAISGPRLAAAIARLGPSYVKLGQFLATRADIVGPKMVRELESLQDRMAPFSRREAIAAIEASFGRPVEAVFVQFGEAVAAASIAQVHRAQVSDAEGTRDVAVKVLRPGIEHLFRRDLSDMYFAARLAERLAPEAQRLKLVEVVDTLARSVKIEMDFRLEAAAASEFAENTRSDHHFRVPEVDWDRTAKEVLTLEWVAGTPLSDMAGLRARGYDLPGLGRELIQAFLRHAVRDGFFHADMHPGNLFVDDSGGIVAVDFGIMGRLNFREQRFLAEILYGFIVRDYRRVAEVHFEAGYVPPIYRIEDFAQAIRAIGEPIHARTADQISMAKLLTLLFEITGLFDMHTRTELVMLQKTMVVVEGVARTLDPKLNMWKTSEPVVRGWIEENLGPLGKLSDVGRGAVAFGRIALRLSDIMARAERLAGHLEHAADQGVRIAPESMSALRQTGATLSRWRNLALWVMAVTLIILAWRGIV